MRHTCQFCDQHPGYLQGFANGWACNTCIFEMGLIDHELLNNKVDIDEQYIEGDEYAAWGHYWCRPYKQGLGYYDNLKIANVIIEELECNPSDLASETHFVHTQLNAKKAEVKARKWQVEIQYLE
jgi:hypothetical protein